MTLTNFKIGGKEDLHLSTTLHLDFEGLGERTFTTNVFLYVPFF